MIYAKLLTELHNMESFIDGYVHNNTQGTTLVTQHVVIKYTIENHQPQFLELDTQDIIKHFQARAASLRRELIEHGVLKKETE